IREHPFILLYEYTGAPFSEIVREGRNYSSTLVNVQGQTYTRVEVQHPKFEEAAFIILFDTQGKMVERRHLRASARGRPRHEHERFLLQEYAPFSDPSGEQIWFPKKVIRKFYSEPFPDGSRVEWMTKEYTIRNIKFNLPIPDEQFVIDLPEGA